MAALPRCGGCTSWKQFLSPEAGEQPVPFEPELKLSFEEEFAEEPLEHIGPLEATNFSDRLDKKLTDLRNLVHQEVARLEHDIVVTMPIPVTPTRRCQTRARHEEMHGSRSRSVSPPMSPPMTSEPTVDSRGTTATWFQPAARKSAVPIAAAPQSTPPPVQPSPPRFPPALAAAAPHSAHISALLAARKKEQRRVSMNPGLADWQEVEDRQTMEPSVRFSAASARQSVMEARSLRQSVRPSNHSEKSGPGALYRHSMFAENNNRGSQLSVEPARMWLMSTTEKGHASGYTRFFLSQVTRVPELPEADIGELRRFLMERVMSRPTSAFSVAWDLIFIFLVCFEVIVVPLTLFGADLTEEPLLVAVMWIARLYWSLSILKNFCTGYLAPGGELKMDPREVARRYAKTWFLLDVIIVICAWTEDFMYVSDILATSRLIRLARTLHVIKAGGLQAMKIGRGIHLLAQIVSWSRSYTESVNFTFGTAKISCTMAAVAHFIACTWYAVGVFGYERGLPNWVEENDLLDESLTRRYSISLHWAVTQFIGSATVVPLNNDEYLFASFVLVFAFVASAGFVSSLTNLMTRLSILGEHHAFQFSMLHKYLRQRNISADLTFRVERAAEYTVAQRQNFIPEDEVEFLQQVTTPLLVEVHYEVFAPVLKWHPLFKEYDRLDKVAFMNICHKATTQSLLAVEDILFVENEEMFDGKMFFIMKGSFVYSSEQLEKRCVVSEGAWVCEIGVWAEGWKHLGELRAHEPCIVLSMDASSFQSTAHSFSRSASMPRKYADAITKHVNLQIIQSPYCWVVDDIDIQDFDAELVAAQLFRKFERLQKTQLQRLSGVDQPEAHKVQAQKIRKVWRFGSFNRRSMSSQLHGGGSARSSSVGHVISRMRSSPAESWSDDKDGRSSTGTREEGAGLSTRSEGSRAEVGSQDSLRAAP